MRITTLLTGLLVAGAILCAGPAPAPAQGESSIGQLSWLSGCWMSRSATQVIEEQWMEPRGRSMLGMSRTVRNDSLTGYELVVIRVDDDRVVYEAHPVGQATTLFPMHHLSDTLAVFENPNHDFPQRVGYRPIGADSLLAWIEGESNGQTRVIEFPYERVACPRRLP